MIIILLFSCFVFVYFHVGRVYLYSTLSVYDTYCCYQNHRLLFMKLCNSYIHVLMRDEKEGRKKQARSNNTQSSHMYYMYINAHA